MASATEALGDAVLAITGAFSDAATDGVNAHAANEPRATIGRRC